jgi:hypothetical protein
MSFIRLRRRGATTLDLVRSVRTPAGPRQRFVATFGTLQGRSDCARALLERARDRLATLPIPPTERAAAARSLCAALRRLGHVIAGQYEAVLAHHAADPRPRLMTLEGCTVAPVPRDEACALIRPFEWLGTVGRCRLFFGLYSPARELIAVVGFGPGPGPGGAGKADELALERGVTLLHAPRNAATFLIARALRALRQQGFRAFKAYTDPAAGETGAIYRALGWLRLPSRHGPWRYALAIAGRSLSDRAIYRRFGSTAAARAAGAAIVRTPARVAWGAP